MARKLLTKLEAMALAAKLAPGLRNFNNRKRIHVTGPDGKVVRELTASEFQKKILEREGVELDADHPLWDACPCGRVFRDGSGGKRGVCNQCKSQTVCPCGCGERPPAAAFSPSSVTRRAGRKWQCYPSAARRAIAAKTPEQRSEVSRKRMAAKTPEQRSEAVRKRAATMTPEQRSEAARKAAAAQTPEQRSEVARKAAKARWDGRR